MDEAIALRDAGPGDAGFLFTLYCDTRAEEVSRWGWPPEQETAFLGMQFDARQTSYAAAYPSAVDRIVCAGQTPIGRMLTACRAGSLCLVDIALLGPSRNRAIGTMLIQELLDDCARLGQSLSLQVAVGSPAERLYRRLGFRESGRDAMYVQMEQLPEAIESAPLPPTH